MRAILLRMSEGGGPGPLLSLRPGTERETVKVYIVADDPALAGETAAAVLEVLLSGSGNPDARVQRLDTEVTEDVASRTFPR